jgi:Sensors of blue-light using FAD
MTDASSHADAGDLLCLVYVSKAARSMEQADLLSLLRQARASNQRDAITGLLLYRRGRFMQMLEGPNQKVRALYNRIGMDARHVQPTTLIKFKPEGRLFADWAMGFVAMDALPDADLVGFSDFLRQDFTDPSWADAPHQALSLLRRFREVPGLAPAHAP